jgi:hypothetical protein
MDYFVGLEPLSEEQDRSECILIGSVPMTATNRHHSALVLCNVHNAEESWN